MKQNQLVDSSVLHSPVLLGALAFGMLNFLLPVYARHLNFTALEIGGLFSILAATTMLIRPFVGWGMDRLGRKRFFVMSLAIRALAWGVFAMAASLPVLYTASLAQGIAASLMWTSAYTIATDLASDDERGRSVARVDAAAAQGALYGTFPGFFLVSVLPLPAAWQVMFALFAVLALVGVWLAHRQVPETQTSITSSSSPPHTVSANLLKLMVIVFITGIASSILSPIWLIFLQDKFSAGTMTLALAYLPAALIYSFLPVRLGWLSDKVGRAPLMALGLIGSGIVSLLLPGLNALVALIALWTLEAVGLVMATPAEEALVADLTDRNVRGTSYGLYTLAVGLGASIGPLLGGWLYDTAGHAAPFYLNAAVLFVCATLTLVLFGRFKSGRPISN